ENATSEQIEQMLMIEEDHEFALRLHRQMNGPRFDEDDIDEEDEDDDEIMDEFDTEDEGDRGDDSSEESEEEIDNSEGDADPRRAQPPRQRIEAAPTRPDIATGTCGICFEAYTRLVLISQSYYKIDQN